ncbi:methyltransferase domain-containing protein [Loktanella sp. DJP18]|uniref:methyltransferase domain-containing protein n=1 Tax=Loktanella sp. DJP18 TaxID=3409788 RepID=UPI003BB6418C
MRHTCRFCTEPLTEVVADLGLSPVSNHFRSAEAVRHDGRPFFPLVVMVCTSCWLVQLTKVKTPPHFHDDYVYFSSFSSSWLRHSEVYAKAMIKRLGLGEDSLVVELASNDGYLLQYFKAAGVPVMGVEPSCNVAEQAKMTHGIDSIVEFFSDALARKMAADGRMADLIVGNNVLAHVPDIGDFVSGLRHILKSEGTVTFEFPHLLRMLEEGQFDTIYHEHFSYLSLLAVEKVATAYGLEVYGIEEQGTHGGSLRIYLRHKDADVSDIGLAEGLAKVRADEAAAGLDTLSPYRVFRALPATRKMALMEFLIDVRRAGKTVVGYGAPAKGNTLLNYCEIGPELLPFTTDLNPAKQGKYLPGVNIPVMAPDEIDRVKPDYVLILPWNLREEIAEQLAHIRDWGGLFVVAMPTLEVF